MRPDTSPARSGLIRHRPWILLLALLLGLAGQSSAEKFDDPIEKFREALKIEEGRSVRYYSNLSEDKEALKHAVRFRRENLERTSKDLRSLSDISRALVLLEWPILKYDPARRRFILPESGYEAEARDIEVKVRADLARRFLDKAK